MLGSKGAMLPRSFIDASSLLHRCLLHAHWRGSIDHIFVRVKGDSSVPRARPCFFDVHAGPFFGHTLLCRRTILRLLCVRYSPTYEADRELQSLLMVGSARVSLRLTAYLISPGVAVLAISWGDELDFLLCLRCINQLQLRSGFHLLVTCWAYEAELALQGYLQTRYEK